MSKDDATFGKQDKDSWFNWFVDGATDGLQGAGSKAVGIEGWIKSLGTMVGAQQIGIQIATILGMIADALGFDKFAQKSYGFAAKLAHRSGDIDTLVRQAGKDGEGLTKNGVNNTNNYDNNDPTQQANLLSKETAYTSGATAAGATVGRVIAVVPNTVIDSANVIREKINPDFKAPKGSLLGKILGKSKIGKALTLGGALVGAFSGSANAAETSSDISAKTAFDRYAPVVDATTDMIPGVDIVKDVANGDYDSALENTGGLAGGMLGAAFATAAVGAAAGAPAFGLGAIPGAVAGFVVGGLGYVGGDYIGRGITSLFNSKATNADAPAHAVVEPTARYAGLNLAP